VHPFSKDEGQTALESRPATSTQQNFPVIHGVITGIASGEPCKISVVKSNRCEVAGLAAVSNFENTS